MDKKPDTIKLNQSNGSLYEIEYSDFEGMIHTCHVFAQNIRSAVDLFVDNVLGSCRIRSVNLSDSKILIIQDSKDEN